MENDLIYTLKHGERVTSTYADTYFDDNYCNTKNVSSLKENHKLQPKATEETSNEWVSPSDLLIGIIELKPPFTSKITRGKTHEGILAIGDEVLSTERAQYEKYLTNLIHENDSAWNYILEHEKSLVINRVREVYGKIFRNKRNTMTTEMSKFYEETLQELETNLKSQIQDILINTHANIISSLNNEIKEKLNKEKQILENSLKKRYESEVQKIKKYYKLLLNKEHIRCNELTNRAIIERNDVLKAFYRQIETENVTSTMYIMCTERKKCRIKQFNLKNYQSLEIKEKYEKLKERQDVINIFKEREVQISQINKEWEEKIKKILELFLKFISFSLKLLPEQASFLLNFEKMVVLQLNEMQTKPYKCSSILIDTEEFEHTFKFEQIEQQKEECLNDPFQIVGDLSKDEGPKFGSRETLPDDVDLPKVRLQRQFVYAECHHYEEIKAMIEAERCKCMDYLLKPPELQDECNETFDEPTELAQESQESVSSKSCYEPLLIDDIHRLDECPARSCSTWASRSSFPYLNSYLDFNEENYKRVLTILGNLPKKGVTSQFIDPKDVMFYRELPFGPTSELYHTVETQYSSREDLSEISIPCPCTENFIPQMQESTKSLSKNLIESMTQRKTSLRRLLQKNPNLLKMFTDESFDF